MVKQILPKAGEAILKLFNKLGGNMNNVLGSRSNITFLGKGKTPEGFIDSDINIDAIGVLGKDKILSELESSIGYLTAGKLNDVQANKLLSNMQKVDEVFNPRQIPNITDLGTGTRDLTQEGLGALRARGDYMTDEGVMASETILPTGKGLTDSPLDDLKNIVDDFRPMGDDLPPPGSRGGPEDIAAPFQSAEKTISNLREIPTKRASAREFLVEALKEDEVAKSGNTFSDFVTKEDLKYITEGGGGVAGDPLVLVEKYFGPRIAEMVPTNASSEEIAIFTKRVLNNVVDAAGNKPDSPRFDRFTARFIDKVQDFAKGGLAKILEV